MEAQSSYRQHLERVGDRRKALRERILAMGLSEAKEGVTLEIGCGHGHWLVDFAAAFPDRECVGIDLIGDRIERAQKKGRRAGVGNARFFKAEALEFLELLPESVSLKEVFMLFPDPWPKKRHWKNRLLSEAFLERIADFCPVGARFYFRTDHKGYFDWSAEIAAALPRWVRAASYAWPFERETVFQAKADDYQSLVLVRR